MLAYLHNPLIWILASLAFVLLGVLQFMFRTQCYLDVKAIEHIVSFEQTMYRKVRSEVKLNEPVSLTAGLNEFYLIFENGVGTRCPLGCGSALKPGRPDRKVFRCRVVVQKKRVVQFDAWSICGENSNMQWCEVGR